jgi:thiamine biosynthesis lipoprotein
MGTECEFKAFAGDESQVDRAFGRGFEEMDRIEGLTTSWRDSSEVARINKAAGKEAVKVSADTLAIIEKSLWVSQLTDGGFDITVGAYKGLWKFDEDNDGSLPAKEEVERRHALVDWHDVIVDHAASTVRLRRPGQAINLGGIAKGYAVDAAVRAIRSGGVRDFIVHAGGDLFAAGRRGDRDWHVGIQDPRGPHGKIIFELPLSDQAFNTSGDYERFILRDGVRYHHILDARTGFPAHLSRSVTLLAKDSFTADALDTAIFVVGAERGMKIIEDLPDLEGVIVDAENKVHVSSGLHERLVKRGDPTPGI